MNISSMRRLTLHGLLLAVALPAVAAAAHAQPPPDQGPMEPPPKYEVKIIPSVPNPSPPPIPAKDIIQKFAANEDVMKKAYDTYTFTRTVHIAELFDSGGKLTVTGEVYTRPDGHQVWRVTTPVASNLRTAIYSLEEVRTMMAFPLFILTTDEIANYNFLYAGQDKLDELGTYVFQVRPKQLSRTRRFFEGVIWVDDHDFTIVKTYGKLVGDTFSERDSLPFKMYETYRENFQGKYWLPTYTVSDDYVSKPPSDQFHLRIVIRSTDFKLQPASPAALPAPPTTPPDPASPH